MAKVKDTKTKYNKKDDLTSEEFFKKWKEAIERVHQRVGTDSQYSEEYDEDIPLF